MLLYRCSTRPAAISDEHPTAQFTENADYAADYGPFWFTVNSSELTEAENLRQTFRDHADDVKEYITENWCIPFTEEAFDEFVDCFLNPWETISDGAGAWDDVEMIDFFFTFIDPLYRLNGIVIPGGAVVFYSGRSLIKSMPTPAEYAYRWEEVA